MTCCYLLSSAAQKILGKARQLVDLQKDDGFAALHLAALNGHYSTAETLISVVCILCKIKVFVVIAGSNQLCGLMHEMRISFLLHEKPVVYLLLSL
jgi:ankyrin repeat protein